MLLVWVRASIINGEEQDKSDVEDSESKREKEVGDLLGAGKKQAHCLPSRIHALPLVHMVYRAALHIVGPTTINSPARLSYHPPLAEPLNLLLGGRLYT